MYFRLWFILSLFLFPFSIIAQDWTLPFTSHIEKDGKGCQGATITLLQGGKQIATQITGNDGAFKFEIPPNGDFMIVVSKQGHCTKKVTVSTRGVPADKTKGAFKGFDIEAISLFEPLPGIDYSVLNQPLVNVTYKAGKDNFDYDEAYSNQMLGALEKLRQLEAAAIAKKQEIETSYKAAIAGGDKAFLKNEWAAAKSFYSQATAIKPLETYPKDQLKQIDKIIADQEALNKKKADDAKKAAEEAAKKKADEDLNNKYLAAMKRGDDAFAKKDWTNAKAGYNDAHTTKPAEQLPKDKLALVDKAMADAAKLDADAKSKAELEAKYLAAIKKGDESFAKKDWTTAHAGYSEAIGIKSAEQYPKTQLALVDKAIADAAAAKAKAEGDAKSKAELEAKYLAAIKHGDDAFAKKDWPTSKAGYNEAIGLKTTEQYPKTQLAAIDKAIADEAAAKAKAESDAKSKAELETKYLAAVKKGDDAFAKKDWPTSKAGYTEATGLKSTEPYPKMQLSAIDKAIAEEAAAKLKAEGDAKSKAELEAKYLAAVKKGDDAFVKKDWSTAAAGYNEAVGLKSAEQYPKTQLALVNKALGDDAAAKAKADADAKAKAELEAKYLAAIKKGDDAFGVKSWTNARVGYNEAVSMKPTEQYPKTQLAAIEKAIADENAKLGAEAKAKLDAELNAKYLAAVKKGDEAFAQKNWSSAKGGYNEALGLKPTEQYPKTQLALIEKALGDDAAAKAKAEADAKAGAKAKAELEAKYLAAIKKGDAAFSKKDWPLAKGGYSEAISIKSSEQYPKDQLAAIDRAMVDEKNNMSAAAKAKAEAEMKAKYEAAIKRGDDNFNNKIYKESKKNYQEALTYKGGDTYATDRLAEIEKLLNSDNNINPDQRLKDLLAKYPPGVTEETIIGTGVVIIQRVLVKDKMAWVYQKKIFSWGGSAFFRDAAQITELTFENETKP